MNIINSNGELYYSTEMKVAEALSFTSLPYTDLSIEWNREEASTLSFKSPVKLTNGDRIRYQSTTDHNFGGQIYKTSKSKNNLYSYEVISYKRLYDTKVIATYGNRTSNEILKDILKKNPNHFRYDGIRSKSTLRHVQLAWNNKSIWEIVGNLAWLEAKANHYINYYIDEVGRLIWEDIPQNKVGLSVNDVVNYDYSNDSTDFITNGIVINQLKHTTLANVKSTNDLLLRWGVIQEFDECEIQTHSTSKTSSTKTSSLKDNKFSTVYLNMKINKFHNEVPAQVIRLTKTICSPNKSDKANLKLIFNWVEKNIGYHYHKDTKHTITACIRNGVGNCCEHSAIMIALARTVGIRAQFVHGHNHVWGRYYINGGWLTIDTSSSRGGWGKHLHNKQYGAPPYSYSNSLSF